MRPDEDTEDDLPAYEVRLAEPDEAEVEAAYLSCLLLYEIRK